MSDQDFRFSEVGHRYLEYANPMSITKIHASIALMGQYKPRHILDIGAGNLYLLDQFVSTLDCDGTALELPGVTSDEAKQRYGKKITLIETDAQEYFESLSSHPFDAAICMGATHALGGFKDCLRTLQKHLPCKYDHLR
ncbi:MAG: class I SAM-dependent methyltransferase [Bdellovibrionota bacterium]